MVAFKEEWFGHHRDRENTLIFGRFGNWSSGAGTGSTAGTASEENHIRTLKDILNFLNTFFRRLATQFRIHAGTEAAGQVFADVDFLFSQRVVEVLSVGVNGHEFHAFNIGTNHVINGVSAGATNSNHFDTGKRFDFWVNFRHDFSLTENKNGANPPAGGCD